MSSARFPGKVLAPFVGRPIIAHVLASVLRTLSPRNVVILTSEEPSDDPLSAYAQMLGARVFRGALTDVFSRFQSGLRENPCDWFFRLSADSPLMDASLLSHAMSHLSERKDTLDLITNVQKRTFPKGHSVELLRAESFAAIDANQLTQDEREHVTKFYYTHPGLFHILNFESGDSAQANINFCVDTIDDLRRLESVWIQGQSGLASGRIFT